MGFIVDTRPIKDLSHNYSRQLSDSDFEKLKREVLGWLSTNDPDYLFAAVLIIKKADLQLKGFLYEQYIELAEKSLKGEVSKSIRKDKIKNILKKHKDFFRVNSVLMTVFELNEICGVSIVEACNAAVAKYEDRRDQITQFSTKPIYARTAKQKYQEWKRQDEFKPDLSTFEYSLEASNNYKFLKNHLNEYRQELYPNMNSEEIKKSIVGDLDKDKYDYLFIKD